MSYTQKYIEKKHNRCHMRHTHPYLVHTHAHPPTHPPTPLTPLPQYTHKHKQARILILDIVVHTDTGHGGIV